MRWMPYFIALISVSALLHGDSPCENPSCLPPLENDERLFPRCKEIIGRVDFLYWTVGEGALGYSIKPRHAAKLLDYGNGKLNNVAYHFRPGVRAFIGYYNAPKYWELSAEYTYIHEKGSSCAHQPKEEGLNLEGTFPVVFTPANALIGAESNICLRYQIVDVLFSRVFDPNPHLRMRLLAGATAAFINQDWITRYFSDVEFIEKVKNDWNFKSGGLRVGLSADWWWRWYLYFSGRITLAGYTGRYKNHATIISNYPEGDGDAEVSPHRDIINKDHRYVQHLQMMLGPSFQYLGNCYHAELFIGYELNGWFNLQEVYLYDRTQFSVNAGALCLHGLTMRATLGF